MKCLLNIKKKKSFPMSALKTENNQKLNPKVFRFFLLFFRKK